MANRGYFKKGEKKTGQGKRGPNKITVEIKSMIEGALADVGGRAYLAKQAEENPGPFLALVGKLLPKEVKAEIEFGKSLGEILRGLKSNGP